LRRRGRGRRGQPQRHRQREGSAEGRRPDRGTPGPPHRHELPGLGLGRRTSRQRGRRRAHRHLLSRLRRVDGPVAAGKGTLARRLAAALDLAYLDTGSIYRALGAKLLADGVDPADGDKAARAAGSLTLKDLERDDLRDETVGQAASIVAAIPAVRAALLAFQRDFAASPPDGKAGAVLDGRDIGTVVCPNAEVKFFVTANTRTRARRRHKELLERGEESIYARVLQDLRDRDARDSRRATAPLKAAEDAVLIDSSAMGADDAFEAAMTVICQQNADR
jgi:cytidylate kinase